MAVKKDAELGDEPVADLLPNGEFDWMIPRRKCAEQPSRPQAEKHLRTDSEELYSMLLRYVPSWKQLKNLGYPVDVKETPNCAIILKQPFRVPKGSRQKRKMRGQYLEKLCVRCGKTFNMTYGGQYLTREPCQFHYGKMRSTEDYVVYMTCCKNDPLSKGCTTAKLHVWSGLNTGMNGPLPGFYKTVCAQSGSGATRKIYVMDCEMAYTTGGLEAVRVTLLSVDGEVVYDSLVRPINEIIDLNTRFSGVTEEDMALRCPKTFQHTQIDLLSFIKRDTILIGHGLENDLCVVKLVHGLVVDTSLIFPHENGFPFRRSLKSLAEDLLGLKIKEGSGTTGHDSVEDCKAALQLVWERVKIDHNIMVEAPSKAVEAPVEAVEAPVKAVEAPVKAVEAPVKAVDAPSKAVEAPVEAVEAPVEAVDAPSKAVVVPVKDVEAPVKAVEAPSKAVVVPLKDVEAPVKAVEAPSKAE